MKILTPEQADSMSDEEIRNFFKDIIETTKEEDLFSSLCSELGISDEEVKKIFKKKK